MPQISYTVSVTIRHETKEKEWLEWMENGHIQDVIAGGAAGAEIIRLERDDKDTPGATYEIRYTFASREVFDTYLERHAPRLRQEGLERFPPEDGFTYRRSVGNIIAQSHAANFDRHC